MKEGAASGVIKLGEIAALIRDRSAATFATALHRGTLDIALSLPVPPNRQQPHAQDELYAVISGTGVLVHGEHRDPFEKGDILFVAAGVEHHYESFSSDLALWRIFYGPDGGEVPDTHFA
jgi:mannose-6-phosphate isomerase-like protein (cupin superfamily)